MPKAPEFNKKATAYIYEGSDWEESEDDDWDILHLTDAEAKEAEHVGQRKIDGVRHNVYKFGVDQFAAQKV